MTARVSAPGGIADEAVRVSERVTRDYALRRSDIPPSDENLALAVAPSVLRQFGEYLRAEAAPHVGLGKRDDYWDAVDWAGRRAIEFAEEIMTARVSVPGAAPEPYRCSQEPHPGIEFYGTEGGCAECGYWPPAPAGAAS